MRAIKVAFLTGILLTSLSAQTVFAGHIPGSSPNRVGVVEMVGARVSQQCVGGTKIDIEDGHVNGAPYAIGSGGTVKIWITNTSGGQVFAWLLEGSEATSVIVKGGPISVYALKYNYSPADTGDTNLHASDNPNSGKYYGVSHICFLTDKK